MCSSDLLALAFSPIAVPIIVTPTGVITVVLFLSLAQSEHSLQNTVSVVIAFLLARNFVGMFFANVHTNYALDGRCGSARQSGRECDVVDE